MPSIIAPVELTRAYSVKPAKGLRYGNFEGVVHLPPVTTKQSLGEHSFSQLNNQQIYKTICEWFQAWRPWQQDLLLCGIANRCSPHQLDILTTTLEPVRHRDYSTVCKKRYPSASFQKDVIPKNSQLKRATHKPTDMCKSTIEDYGMHESRGSTQTKTSSERAATNSRSKYFKKKKFLPSVTDSSAKSRFEKNKDSSPASKSTPAQKHRPEKNKQFSSLSNSAGKPTSNRSYKSLPVTDDRSTSMQNSNLSNNYSASDKKEQLKIAAPPSTVDEYSQRLSLDIIQSAFQIVTAACKYDKTLFQTPDTARENTIMQNIQTDDKMNIIKTNIASTSNLAVSSLQNTSSQNTMSSSQSNEKNEQSHIISTTASAPFLGGMLELKSESAKSFQSGRGLLSASSVFRHGAFTASTVSTAAFFSPNRIERFGSPLCEMPVGSVRHLEGLSGVPISLTRIFQHHKWWRGRSLDGSLYALRKPSKKELSINFRDQLGRIWEWLHQWEDFERIALLKEVVKMASPCILSSLITHIHQKLRDQLDLNRLPDKLILFILSFLPPEQINVSSQVCRRWRFLTASDELWMLKCLEMGEMEGVENIPKLVLDASKSDRLVDWKQAFYELRFLVHVMKEGLSRPSDIDIDALYPPENAPLPVEMTIPDESDKRRASCRMTELKLPRGTVSYTQMGDVEDEKNKLVEVDEMSDDDVSLDEDLLNMMGEYALEHESEGPDSPDMNYIRRRRKISRKKSQSDIADLSVSLEEPIKEESPLKEVIRSKRRHQNPSDEEEDEKPQDIRPKLEQAIDLLGKIVPSTTLEWQTTEDETKVPLKTTTFAGMVKIVQRVRKLQGHMSGIVCLKFDKKRLITGGMDRTVRIWDIRSGSSIHKFCGHKGGIRCLQFDDDILATGSWDTLIVLWDMKQFTKVTALVGHSGCVSALQINKHYVVSGSHDCTIRVWSRLTYYCSQVIKTHTGAINSLVLDGDCVLSSSSDMTLRMSNIDTGHSVRVFDAVQKSILSLVIANNLVIGGDQTGSIYFWNKSTGESEAAIRAHDAPVYKVAYGNGRFWTASGDNTVKEWDLMTLTCVRALQGHKGSVRDVKVSEDRVVSCSDDGTIRIWDFKTSKQCKK